MGATVGYHPNTIPEVRIGTQIWASKNYDFGGSNPNNVYNNINDYGKLYTWDEAMAIDYPGWHLPTSTEFQTLITYLGGNTVAGGHMKEIGTTYWLTPNTGADNTSGFSGRGAGYISSGTPGSFMELAYFWTSSESDDSATYFGLNKNTILSYTGLLLKSLWRFSVRLIKD